MNNDDALNNLQQRNNLLKFKLAHKQLKSGSYSFQYFQKYSKLVLNQYKIHKSIIKAASIVGIDYKIVIGWYIQGQLNNPLFRKFYLLINEINGDREVVNKVKININVNENTKDFDGDYLISEYGDGWSYKTYVDGEKIFIISNELETLKKKVKDRKLPLD